MGPTSAATAEALCSKHARQYDGYTYLENAVTGQRQCRWTVSAWGHIDYTFMRPGDVSYGPFGREVYD